MPEQLALRFDEVPVTCPAQERYHAIAPCLARRVRPQDRARELNVSYGTLLRWLREFRERGMPGLFPAAHYPREPYTPERVIVSLLYYKCCVPRAADAELARVVGAATGHRLHNETVKALLERYFFWRIPEFRDLITYPVPHEAHDRRREMARLHEQGWTEKSIATLLACNAKTVNKWLRRYRQRPPGVSDQGPQPWLLDQPRAPHQPRRKAHFGAIQAVLTLQKKYGYAGWFRIQGYLARDYDLHLGASAIKKIMALNRRLHLAPTRPARLAPPQLREGPPHSRHPFEYAFIDLRYLDAKPQGVQLYSCLLLEGFSRTILAGSLTRRQDVGVVLGIYYLALLNWGCWQTVISDHGGQFRSLAFARVNRRLAIRHAPYEKGHPWQNLIESQFGIQARLGEYGWGRCPTVEAAQEWHRQLIRDHNRLPHFAHRRRNDQRHSPLEVLAQARGRAVEAADLHRAFSRMSWKRRVDPQGFVRVGRWRIYVEAGLPKAPVQVTYWDGKLRAEYESHTLAEYDCRWDKAHSRPKLVSRPQFHPHPFQSPQHELFDPLWVRDPVMIAGQAEPKPKPGAAAPQQLHLYLGPELVRTP